MSTIPFTSPHTLAAVSASVFSKYGKTSGINQMVTKTNMPSIIKLEDEI